jgi:hypothetical protein
VMVRLFASAPRQIKYRDNAKSRTIASKIFKIQLKQDERLPGGWINRPLAHVLVSSYAGVKPSIRPMSEGLQ